MQVEQLFKQSIIWRGLYFIVLLLLNIVVAHIFKAATAGIVFFYTNVFSLFILLGTCNVENGFTYFASSRQIPQTTLAWLGVIMGFLGGLLLQPIIFLYSLFFGSMPSLQLYAAFYCIGLIWVNIFLALFYSEKNYKTPSICLIISNIGLIASILLAYYWHMSLQFIQLIYFIFFLIQGVALMLLYLYKHQIFTRIVLPTWMQIKKLFQFAFTTLYGNIVFFFLYRLDYWFVHHYSTAAALGNYIQASKMAQLLLVVPQILASVLFPQTAAGNNRTELVLLILRVGRLFFTFLLLIELLAITVGNQLFIWLFGASFNTANSALLLLIPGIAALALLTLLSSFFSGIKKANINTAGALLALLVAIILNIALVPTMGIQGAALASCLSYIVNVIFALVRLKKYAAFSFTDVVVIKKEDIQWLHHTFFKKQQP